MKVSLLFVPVLLASCSSFKGQREIAEKKRDVMNHPATIAHTKAEGMYNLEEGDTGCPKQLELMWSHGERGSAAFFVMPRHDFNSFSFSFQLLDNPAVVDSIFTQVVEKWEDKFKEESIHTKSKQTLVFKDNTLVSEMRSEERFAKNKDDYSFNGTKVEGVQHLIKIDYSVPNEIQMAYKEQFDRTPLNFFRSKKVDVQCRFKKP